MGEDNVNRLYRILDRIPQNENNKEDIEETRDMIKNGDLLGAVKKIKEINSMKNEIQKPTQNEEDYDENEDENREDYEEDNEIEAESNQQNSEEENYENDNKNEEENNQQINEDEDDTSKRYEEYMSEYKRKRKTNDDGWLPPPDVKKEKVLEKYPKEISNFELEKIYIGLILNNPQGIYKYFYLFEDCFFEDDDLLNIYKSVLFTEGAKYTPEVAKRGFNFSKDSEEVYKMKVQLKKDVKGKGYNMEQVYVELKKLFILRKYYRMNPIEDIQKKIVEIKSYELYDKMTVEEIEAAVNQVMVTNKFKQAILNSKLTEFLERGRDNLANGLSMPFPILTSVFKGIRKGETMAYAMPSNAGKSRLTIDLAAYTAFVHKKKVLVISNEMSEEKMRLCLITTIINNPDIQKQHGHKLKKTEGEILEFKFRPDSTENVEVDENGFVIQREGESQEDYVKRLTDISTEFRETIEVTDWIDKEVNNSIYFINITDHTNDELQKVIINFYYKEHIEYVFYDTLKTDTANIGIGEEIKKTATILANIAQNFRIYICSSLQLTEGATLPINLSVLDLAVSRTVKEVLDTLMLMKQINRENYADYQYSLNEVDTKFFELEKFDDPDVRYYACVVDKNRAGAKPKVLFRLNLAYNQWEELGYLSLKQGETIEY